MDEEEKVKRKKFWGRLLLAATPVIVFGLHMLGVPLPEEALTKIVTEIVGSSLGTPGQ